MDSPDSQEEDRESKNKTIFDIYRRRLKDNRKTELLHQLVMIGKLGSISPKNVKALNEERNEAIRDEEEQKSLFPTGLFLIYSDVFIHIIESSTRVINKVITMAAEDVAEKVLEQATILIISHDIPNHLYKYWHCVLIKDISSKSGPVQDNTLQQKISGILEQVIKLGVHLRDVTLTQFEASMEGLMHVSSDLLPRQTKINELLQEPSLLSAQNYVDQYARMKPVILHEELVWPAPDKLVV